MAERSIRFFHIFYENETSSMLHLKRVEIWRSKEDFIRNILGSQLDALESQFNPLFLAWFLIRFCFVIFHLLRAEKMTIKADGVFYRISFCAGWRLHLGLTAHVWLVLFIKLDSICLSAMSKLFIWLASPFILLRPKSDFVASPKDSPSWHLSQ